MPLLYLCVIVVLRPSIKPPVPLRCTYTKKKTTTHKSHHLKLRLLVVVQLIFPLVWLLLKPHPGFTLPLLKAVWELYHGVPR